MPLDPICKKIISRDTEYFSDYGGKNYYFCSSECKHKFDALEKSVIRLKRNLSEKEKISFGKLKRDVTIQPLIKKYVFSAKCCNSQDNSGAPLSAARIASITFKPFFLIVEM